MFNSNEKADSATDAYVKQILTGQGYKIIKYWPLTIWRHSDFDVKIVMTRTVVPNYGFPADLMDMQLYIADGTGKILINDYIDRANLEIDLRDTIPACNASPPSTPPPDSNANAGAK